MQNSDTSEDESSSEDTSNTPLPDTSETAEPNTSTDSDSNGQSLPDAPGSDEDDELDADDEIDKSLPTLSWEGPEFIHHQKTTSWYGLLFLIAIVLSAIVYVLTKDVISTAVIIVGAILFAIYGARQPRQITYQINAVGLDVGQRHFKLDTFRAFSTIREGTHRSIVFTPLKRFGALTTIYYPREKEPEIINLLTGILPFTEFKHDAIDLLMHKIKF